MLPHALHRSVSASLDAPVTRTAPLVTVAEPSAPAPRTSPATRKTLVTRFFAVLVAIAAVASLGACNAPNNSTKGVAIVNMARTHIGAPYVYGAAGPYTFDCSGLVQYVHRQVGINVPRTTQDQLVAARWIPQNAAAPGDVIFFGNYHVGIYVGGGQIIDAPKTGDVVRQRAIWTSAYSVGRFY